MTEAPIPNQIPPEVVSMRAWIEQEIIGKVICPPLAGLAQRYRGEGKLDWDKLSKDVEILSFFQLSGDKLSTSMINVFNNFLREAPRGTHPMSTLVILPDFPTNDDYDIELDKMRYETKKWIAFSDEGPALGREIVLRYARQRNSPRENVKQLLHAGPAAIANEIVDGMFLPVNFYGKRITNQDLVTFPDVRGPVERYQILSRAPYYAFQLINPLLSFDLDAGIDRQRVEERNTRLASRTNAGRYESIMNTLRARKQKTAHKN
jgi:hypothetical protein